MAETQNLQRSFQEPKPPQNHAASTSDFYLLVSMIRDKFASMNQKRLLLVQIDVLLSVFNKGLLGTKFGVLGVGYLFRLAFDVFTILYETLHLKPSQETARWSAYLQNFKEAMGNNKRNNRMVNDVLWGGLNLASLIVAPPLAIMLTLGGFCFDGIYGLSQMAYKSLQFHKSKKLLHQVEKDEAALQKLTPLSKQAVTLREKISATSKKINLKHAHKDIGTYVKKHSYDLGIMTGLYVGMGLCMFPPTMLPGAIVLGTFIAISVADIIRKQFARYKRKHATEQENHVTESKAASEETAPLLNPNGTYKQLSKQMDISAPIAVEPEATETADIVVDAGGLTPTPTFRDYEEVTSRAIRVPG